MNPRVQVSAAAMHGLLEVVLHGFGKLLGCAMLPWCPTLLVFGTLRVASSLVASSPSSMVPCEIACW